MVLARALSLDDYGVLNVCIAAAGIAITATTLGLGDLGARDLAVRPQSASWFAGRLLAARFLVLSALAALALVVVAIVAPGSLPIAALTAAMAFATTASADWMLRGFERMRELGSSRALGGLTVLAGSLLVWRLSGSVDAALAAFIAGEIVTSASCWLWAGRSALPRFGISGVRPLLARSWPLAISTLALYSYYANLDTVIIAATRSAGEAGLYSAAYRVFLTLNLVAIFAGYAYMPILAQAVASGDDSAAMESMRRGLRYMVAYGALVLGVAELAAGPLLGALFGSAFSGEGHVLTVLCIAIAWYVVGFPVGYTLIARDRNRGFLAGAATAALVSLALDLALIPPFGPIGAATATVVAFVAAALVWLRNHGILDRRLVPHLAVITALSLGAVLALVTGTGAVIGVLSLGAALVLAAPALTRRVGIAQGK